MCLAFFPEAVGELNVATGVIEVGRFVPVTVTAIGLSEGYLYVA